MPTEASFQRGLIKEIKDRFPGSIVLKTDPKYKQGMPDLLILYKDKWASLEVKRDAKAKHQPNQDYYVGRMREMSYSAFIFPENKEAILNGMERSFKS